MFNDIWDFATTKGVTKGMVRIFSEVLCLLRMKQVSKKLLMVRTNYVLVSVVEGDLYEVGEIIGYGC